MKKYHNYGEGNKGFYLTGNYKGTVDFNPNAGTSNLVSDTSTSDIL
ncbi:MAG: hypothetical protein IPN13_15230 [Bacteroidetes bacterium]|nr:hypothetical protein [Bacteroidota bacterium]